MEKMVGLTGFLILGFPCLLTAQNVFNNQSRIQWPKSTAVRVGQEVRLNLTIAPGQPYLEVKLLAWLEGDNLLPTYIYEGTPNGGSINPDVEEDFIDVPEKRHDVKIKAMKWKLGRVYFPSVLFREPDDEDDEADIEVGTVVVTAIDEATCNNGGSDEVVEGEQVILNCEVTYSGPLAPNLKWKTSKGMELNAETLDHGDRSLLFPKTAVNLHRLTASRDHDGKLFHCDISFEDILGDGEYTDRCTTMFNVQYGPKSIQFEPEPVDEISYFRIGDTLNCSARANPEPTYSWSGGFIEQWKFVEGPILRMKSDMVGEINKYICVAQNKLKNNEVVVASRVIKFKVIDHASSVLG